MKKSNCESPLGLSALRLACFSFVVFLCTPLLHAAGWRVTPSAGVGAIYTDNVTLAPSNEEDEFITELEFGVTAVRQGGRLNADIDYTLQGLLYAEEGGRNGAFHQLDSNATLEVARERFFLDAESTITQQVIDPRRGGAAGNISVNNNRASVITASVGPRYQQRFSNSLEVNAQYRTAVVEQFDSDNDAASANIDSNQYEYSASLGANPSQRALRWILEYSQTKTENENGAADVREEELSLSLFYPLANSLTLIGVVGEERNEFARANNTAEPDGSYWEAGIQWQASARDLIEFRRGERFFGETYSFDWQHRGRRYNGNVSYSEEVTTNTSSFLNGGNTSVTQLSSQAIVTKQFDTGWSVSLPKSTASFSLFETRNEFQLSQTEDETRGVQLDWRWDVAPRTLLSTGLTFQRSEFGDSTQENTEKILDLEVQRRLSSVSTTSVGYTYSELESNVVSTEFEVNTLIFRFNHTF